MELLNVISIVTLAAVTLVGVILKRYTKRTLSDIDGMGDVSTAREAEAIAKF